MRTIVGCWVLFLASFALSAHATKPSLLWCDSCSIPQQKAAALTRPEGETVYVGDVVNRTLSAYVITVTSYDDSYNPPRPIIRAVPTALTSPYNDVGNALITFYNTTPVGWTKRLDLNYGPYSMSTNVYDVVTPGTNQNVMLDWVSHQQGPLFQQLDNSLLSIFAAFRVIDATKLPNVTFVIHFNDGSKITVTVDFSTTPPTYKVVQNSGIDSHHNTVPSTLPNGSLLFSFAGPGNPTDQQDWIQLMTRFGYDIPISPGAYWACTNSPAGLHCVHPY